MFEMHQSTKDLASLCSAICLVFLAYNAVQNLESSAREGVGTIAIGVIYVVAIFSTALAPKLATTLGRKLSMVFGSLCYVLFIASNLHPVWGVMIPAAVLLGFGAAILWPVMLSYIQSYATSHSELTSKNPDDCLNLFSSVFWGSFQGSQLLGNLLTYLIIHFGHEDGNKDKHGSKRSETVLITVFAICALLGSALLFSSPDRYREYSKTSSGGSISFWQTMEVLRSLRNLLLVPLYFYNGLEQSFAWCDFTKSMIGPAYGGDLSKIGLIMMLYSGTNVLVGLIASRLPSRRMVTASAIVFAICLQGLGVIWFRFIVPEAGHQRAVPALALILGMGDAILNTKISLMLGTDFKGEGHLITVSLWRAMTSLGCAIPFFIAKHSDITEEVLSLAILGVVSVVFFIGYNLIPIASGPELKRLIS